MHRVCIVTLLLAGVAACGPRDVPIARVSNNSAESVAVYDGAFQVVALAPGAKGEGRLLGAGLRSLSVRSAAWVTMTEPFRFEENRRWLLAIGADGVAAITLPR